MMKFVRTAAVAVALFAAHGASATQLITNGGFESGLAGWTVSNQAGGSGSWYAASGTSAPLSGLSTVGASAGSQYAVTDQTGPGTHALTQSFSVAPGASSVILSFNMFVNSEGGFSPNGGVLNYVGPSTEFGRVDLLSGAAGAFDTAAGVLSNLFLGVDSGNNPHAYGAYTFDITSLVGAGGTFQLRFAESDNQGFLNMGIDNVSIDARAAAVPEPGSLALLGLGAICLASIRRRKQA